MSTLTRKGQTTVPKEVRKNLHLEAGAILEWFPQKDGTILLKPRNKSALSIKGIIRKPPKPVSIADMNNAIGNMAASTYKDSVQ